jgi:hypothetical protein
MTLALGNSNYRFARHRLANQHSLPLRRCSESFIAFWKRWLSLRLYWLFIQVCGSTNAVGNKHVPKLIFPWQPGGLARYIKKAIKDWFMSSIAISTSRNVLPEMGEIHFIQRWSDVDLRCEAWADPSIQHVIRAWKDTVWRFWDFLGSSTKKGHRICSIVDTRHMTDSGKSC